MKTHLALRPLTRLWSSALPASFSTYRFTPLALTLTVAVALRVPPARAQFVGMPVWNTPSGRTGTTMAADHGRPDSENGKGNAWGARSSLSVGAFTITLGYSGWKPDGTPQKLWSFGGSGALRMMSSALPVAVNVQVGVVHEDSVTTKAPHTAVTGALGISVLLVNKQLNVEPYVSPGIRYRDGTNVGGRTEFGYAVGANLGFGLVGVHLAFDRERLPVGRTASIFGIGAHLFLKQPRRLPVSSGKRVDTGFAR